MININDYFFRKPILSSLIHFDPFWTDLIQYDPKKITIFMIKGKEIDKKDYEFVKCGKSGKFGIRHQEKHVKSFR